MYVIIFCKNKFICTFFSHSKVMVLFKFALITVGKNYGNLYQGYGVKRFKI